MSKSQGEITLIIVDFFYLGYRLKISLKGSSKPPSYTSCLSNIPPTDEKILEREICNAGIRNSFVFGIIFLYGQYSMYLA